MRAMLLALALFVATAFAENPDIRRFSEINVGTNTYRNVALKKCNGAEAILRFESGLMLVKIADLPEPLRSEWLDSTAAAACENKNAEHAKAILATIEAHQKDAQKNGTSLAEFYRRNVSDNKALLQMQSQKTQALLRPHTLAAGSLDDQSLTDAALEDSLTAEQQRREDLKLWQSRASAFSVAATRPAAPSRPKAPSNLRIQ